VTKKLKEFKPTQDQVSAARAVFVSMAYADTVREVVEEYQKEFLDTFKPENKKFPRHNVKIITRLSDTYLMNDFDFDLYLDWCEDKAKEHKLTLKSNKFGIIERGYCPLLAAEEVQRQAEHLLIESMESITGLTLHKIICSGLENLRKYIDLTLRLLAPYVKPIF